MKFCHIHLRVSSCILFVFAWALNGVAFAAPVFNETPSLEIEVDAHPALFALGDITGDRRADIVVADRENDALLVYPHRGGHGAPQSLALSGSPRALLLTDLNGDGRIDMLAPSNRRMHVLFGKDNFTNEHIHTNNNLLARGVRSVATGRLMEGGDDILAGPVLLRWQPTRNRFQNGYFRGPEANDNSFVILGDLDNSGIDEAVFAVRDKPAIRIYYGPIINPSVHVEELSNFVELKAPFVVTALAIGDVNGDGRPDIIASGRTGVAVFLQDSPTGFQDGAEASFFLQGPGGELAVADIDGDGTTEWIVGDIYSSAANRAVYVFKAGQGVAIPSSFADAAQRLPARALVGMQLFDYTGDGRPDMVLATDSGQNSGCIVVYTPANR